MENRHIFNRSKTVYLIDDKYYRMPLVDLHHKTARLVEVDKKGNYLYDEDGMTIKRDLPIAEFEKLARVVNILNDSSFY